MHTPGSRIGPFRLETLLGSGGMGSVWAAQRDGAGEQLVALKIPHAHLGARPEALQRLRREASVSRLVEHPTILPVLEVLEFEGTLVLVMDLLAGETLRARLNRHGHLATAETSALLGPVASALCAAHEAGVVHRDLKPENIFISQSPGSDEAVKVLDFGVAKLLVPSPSAGELRTALGSMLGTVAYMAPEQVLGAGEVDASADVWALGAVLYEALAGCRAVEGADENDAIRRLLTEGIVPLDAVAPDLPTELVELVARMLDRSPERRPRSAEVEQTLLRLASGAPNPPSPD